MPNAVEWRQAGELAGRAARVIAGSGRRLSVEGRTELVSDAVTAVVALRAGVTVVTADADFDLLQQLVLGLQVAFYDVVEVA